MKAKICGITNVEDALAADFFGADYLGMIFAEESPRKIGLKDAEKISSLKLKNALLAGVFLNGDANFVFDCAKKYRLSVVQLHGDESYDYVVELRKLLSELSPMPKIWKSVYSEEAAKNFRVDALLVDSRSGAKFGGTGLMSDWKLAAKLAKNFDVVLAGGISEANVFRAAREVKPLVLDANSSLEVFPGKKDISKVEKFLKAVKEAK